MESADERVVAVYRAGNDGLDELNKRIENAWKATLNDTEEKRRIASILNVEPIALKSDIVPFEAEISRSGLTGGEVAIIVAVPFLVEFTKSMAGAAGKAAAERLRDYWTDTFKKKVSPLGSGILKDKTPLE